MNYASTAAAASAILSSHAGNEAPSLAGRAPLSERVELLLAAGLVVATFLAYTPCWHGGWLWDDAYHLLDNPVLKPGGLLKTWIPSKNPYINYWPATFTIYWLENQLWGLRPLGFHLVNIGVHAISALLVWRILRQLRMPGALLAAAIFALHPVNVEAVAWVAQLKTVLSMMLALLSVLLYLANEQQPRLWRYLLAIAAFALSGLAKGEALPLPVVLLALAWWQRGRITRRDVLRVVPYFIASAIMAGIEVWSERTLGAGRAMSASIFQRAATAGIAVWFYFWKFIWPVNLIPIYPHWHINASNPLAYVPGIVLIGVLALAWCKRSSWGRPVVMLIVCYVALLMPVLGFVNIMYFRYSLVADHWQYAAMVVPIAGFASLAASLVKQYLPLWAIGFGCLALMSALATLTCLQSHLYSDLTLYCNEELAKDPKSWPAYYTLAIMYSERGDRDLTLANLQRADEINDSDVTLENEYASVLLLSGQNERAIAHWNRALEIDPKMPDIHMCLAIAYAKLGESDRAIEQFQAELEILPDDSQARDLLSKMVASREQTATELAEAGKALQQSPKNVDTLIKTAWILATTPFASLRNGREAVKNAELAWKITGGDNPRVLCALGAAYAETGRFNEAIIAGERGLQVAERTDSGTLAREISGCLSAYRQGKPYRNLAGY